MVLFSNFLLHSQVHDETKNQRNLLQTITCASPNVGFIIDGIFYTGALPIFICTSLLPIDIIFSDSTGTPINDPALTWHGDIAHISTDPTYKSKLLNSNFSGNLANFAVKYGTVSVKAKVSIDVDFRPKPGVIEHGYDNNQITQYWPSATNPPNTPWLFARPSTSPTANLAATNLVGDTLPIPKSLFNHIRVASSSTSIATDHNRFKKRFDDFIVTNNGVLGDSIHLTGCTTRKNLFLFTKAPNVITVPIKFYIIGETDDDECNYCATDSTLQKDCKTKINSSTFECIKKGLDGAYEEEIKILEFAKSALPIYKPSWISLPKDSIITTKVGLVDIPVIVSGSDNICNTKPIPKNTYYDPKATSSLIQQFVDEGNSILNQYAVNLVYNGTIEDTIRVNYDVWKNNNNQVDRGKLTGELDAIYKKIQDNDSTTLKVYFVRTINDADNNLPNYILGIGHLKGNVLGLNSFYDPNAETMCHEIGHALWALRHPDNDSLFIKSPLNPENRINDKFDIMHSQAQTVKQIFRHYAWRRIHLGKYN